MKLVTTDFFNLHKTKILLEISDYVIKMFNSLSVKIISTSFYVMTLSISREKGRDLTKAPTPTE